MYKKWDNLDPFMYGVEGIKKWTDNFLNPNFYVEISTNNLSIKNVIFNPPATIVFWSDGTKTKAICDKDDKFSKECGISICIAKKLLGNKEFKKTIDIWCEDDRDINEAKYKVGDILFSKTSGKAVVIAKVEWNKIKKVFIYATTTGLEYAEKELDICGFKFVCNEFEKVGIKNSKGNK